MVKKTEDVSNCTLLREKVAKHQFLYSLSLSLSQHRQRVSVGNMAGSEDCISERTNKEFDSLSTCLNRRKEKKKEPNVKRESTARGLPITQIIFFKLFMQILHSQKIPRSAKSEINM